MSEELLVNELMFSERPQIDYGSVTDYILKKVSPNTDVRLPEGNDSVFLITHKDFAVEYSNGKAPAQTARFQ